MLVSVGHKNFIPFNEIVAIASYPSDSIVRSIEEAKTAAHRVIDLCAGNSIKAVLFLISGDIILSALDSETIMRKIVAH